METTRDDFTSGVKTILAHRAGFRCSKPSCRALTAGPSDERPDARTNVGVASHITGAAPGGPRYDAALADEDRRSVTNGIWLCQTHGKEIDDDEARFTPDVLRAWKIHAEEDARAMLGRPISSQALDATVQVVMHRADNDDLLVMGSTNLPDGTKLWIQLYESRSGRPLGTGKTTVAQGSMAAAGFSNRGHPHPHDWYKVEVLGHFNGPWQQPEAVVAIVGHEGEFLAGRFAEPLHPELPGSEKRFRAEFECIAPPLRSAPPLTPADIGRAITITRATVLTVDGRRSAESVGDVVAYFMSFPELREFQGWSGDAQPNGAVIVRYSYWNGSTPAVADWIVVLPTREVRYRNLHGKLMSWASSD